MQTENTIPSPVQGGLENQKEGVGPRLATTPGDKAWCLMPSVGVPVFQAEDGGRNLKVVCGDGLHRTMTALCAGVWWLFTQVPSALTAVPSALCEEPETKEENNAWGMRKTDPMCQAPSQPRSPTTMWVGLGLIN